MNRVTFIILILSLVQTGCFTQVEKEKKTGNLKINEITYQFDSTKWYVQSSSEVVDFMQNSGLKSQFKADELIAVYTYNKTPVINYPSIMVVRKVSSADPPPMNQLEKELGAMSLTLNDFDPNLKLKDHLKNWDFRTPILIKEKKQIIMESGARMNDGSNLKIRQTMFFRKRKIVVVQISYIENRDEKHLDDFYRIIETIEF